jgi:starvation-inducible DNA-binding protein
MNAIAKIKKIPSGSKLNSAEISEEKVNTAPTTEEGFEKKLMKMQGGIMEESTKEEEKEEKEEGCGCSEEEEKEVEEKKEEKCGCVAKALNDLLANYQVFKQNVHGISWNLTGITFFELHDKFGELYDCAAKRVDGIAERILAVEGIPMHSFTNYLKISEITEVTGISDGVEAVKISIEQLETLVSKEHEIVELATERQDNGTIDLISGYIVENEKLLWMYKAYVK